MLEMSKLILHIIPGRFIILLKAIIWNLKMLTNILNEVMRFVNAFNCLNVSKGPVYVCFCFQSFSFISLHQIPFISSTPSPHLLITMTVLVLLMDGKTHRHCFLSISDWTCSWKLACFLGIIIFSLFSIC